MKKILAEMKNLKLLLVFLILSVSVTLSGQTIFNGGIFNDTTFYASNSPYIITADIAIYPDVTLNVEAGTEIQFSPGTNFFVRGNLNLNGTDGNHVILTSHSKDNSPLPWEGIDLETDQGGKIVGTYVIAEYANRLVEFTSEDGSGERVNLSNAEIRECEYAFYGHPHPVSYSVSIANSDVHHIDYAYVYGQNVTITDCIFAYGEKGIHGWKNPNNVILNSEFHDFSVWPFNTEGLIQNCHIHHNSVGIRMKPFLEVTECLIEYNQNGVVAEYPIPVPGENIYENIICGNLHYDFKHLYSYPINIPDNCWCTNDPGVLEENVLHAFDNVELGIVTFTPFDSGCSPTEVEEELQLEEVLIYPNPANDIVYLDINARIEYELYTLGGSVILTGETSSEIDISSLSPGLYFVKLETPSGYSPGVQKIVKQ